MQRPSIPPGWFRAERCGLLPRNPILLQGVEAIPLFPVGPALLSSSLSTGPGSQGETISSLSPLQPHSPLL